MKKIINIAVIAHVDAGKSTLVDAFLSQSNTMEASNQVMDSNDLEKERGITIYAKNCSINYKDYKINIVDTPGHADFSSEVERIIRTVDTVILLVDSAEGVMPQTRFVLQKSLNLGLNPILLINKIDKPDQRATEVIEEVLELFLDLDANDKQLEFPTLFGIAKQGIVKYSLDDDSKDLTPLFNTIIEHVDIDDTLQNKPTQMQISSLAYDDYIGRLGIGRIYQGTLEENQDVLVYNQDGELVKKKIQKLFVYEGLGRKSVKKAYANDIVVVSGISDITIGETICDVNDPQPLDLIEIEKPTMAMNFLVNKSPFAGQEGQYLTTRNIKDRLDRELEVNVGLMVEPLESAADGFKVSGRGELHLSILLENMRREGFEIAVSKPEVIYKEIDGKLCEPIERVQIDVPEEYSGTIINSLNLKKGEMINMIPKNNQIRIEYLVPTRSLIGYNTQFINDTHGEGIMVKTFDNYQEYKGALEGRKNGVFISGVNGDAMAYSLMNLSERGTMFITPGVSVYEGMIVGMNSRDNDLVVNPTKNKKLTNVRASGSDDAIRLGTAIIMSLEDALAFIEDDELVEITPENIRLRKKYLNEVDRKRANKQLI
ncbi:GTP-binding protein [Bacilli bacterium PM5-3]|nr:GTP-binding protein [Bacilli bacterium PM5-3]MDH6603773.1 GTP-binding protein [Bacilli bacterium PM5-9]